MFNEMDRLRDSVELYTLLSHYAERNGSDWQDRRMQQGDCTARQLASLHGELIAYGWVEQNTGMIPILRKDQVPACYRITSAGRRALKQHRAEQEVRP
jgi:hypothetical protein